MNCSENLYSVQSTKIIRLSIFIIGGVCAGFPALIWALSVLYHHYKSGSRTSAFIIFLLLSDLLELILNPLLVTYILKKDSYPCEIILKILFIARLYGQLLHQIVALESICQRCNSISKVFTPLYSTIFSIIFLLASGCHFLHTRVTIEITAFVCILPFTVCSVTYLLTCKVPQDMNQDTDRKSGVLVLPVSMFTLIIIYMPFFLTYFFNLPFMLDCLISLRLISDPLLCVLVCRELSFNSHIN